MSEHEPSSVAATVVISLRVPPERRAEYEAWQAEIDAAAEAFPGFAGVEVVAPASDQDDWVVVFRFDTPEHLEGWMRSDRRRALLDEAAPLVERVTEDVVATPAPQRRAVTVVAAHRVKPGREAEFERWEAGITDAARRFAGYLGSELLRPVAGVQKDWVVVFRFASAASLRHWLDSPERMRWLSRGEDLIERVALHQVNAGLGGWFPGAVVAAEAPLGPPDYKQAMAVVLALYPTVMLLTLYFAPRLERLPFAANVFVNNVASVAVLQWLLMPLVTRWLAPWLGDTAGRVTWLGILGLLVAYAAMVVGFATLA